MFDKLLLIIFILSSFIIFSFFGWYVNYSGFQKLGFYLILILFSLFFYLGVNFKINEKKRNITLLIIVFVSSLSFGYKTYKDNLYNANEQIKTFLQELKTTNLGYKLYNLKKKIRNIDELINNEIRENIKKNLIINDLNFEYPIFIVLDTYSFLINTKNDKKLDEIRIYDNSHNFTVPIIFQKNNNFISFDTALIMKSNFINQSNKPIWINKLKNKSVFHHWGDSFNDKIYLPGRLFFDLPNEISELFSGLPYATCKRKNAWNETIEVIDNNTGEHLETIELLKIVAKVKDNFKRIGDTPQECFDPVHINDVRIVKKQTHADYFTNGKIGDLLVSLREIDAVVLMDRDTYDIKWITRGNFTRQHSPRITNRGTIIIFDNQSSLPPNGMSRITEIDIKTNELVGFYEATGDSFFESQNRGRLQIVDNRIFVQEHNQGRLFELICNSQYISNNCKQKNIIELKENNRAKGYYLADIVKIQ